MTSYSHGPNGPVQLRVGRSYAMMYAGHELTISRSRNTKSLTSPYIDTIELQIHQGVEDAVHRRTSCQDQ